METIGEDEKFLGKVGFVVHGGNKSWEKTGDIASDFSNSLLLGFGAKHEFCREVGCLVPAREAFNLVNIGGVKLKDEFLHFRFSL